MSVERKEQLPARLVEGAHAEGSREARIAARLRHVVAAPIPRAPVAPRFATTARPRGVVLVRRLGYVALLVSSVAAAVTITREVVERRAAERMEQARLAHASASAAAPASVANTDEIAASDDEPAMGSPEAPAPQPQPRARTTPARRRDPAPSALAAEAAWLEHALSSLRKDHDPEAALEALDRHRAAFPRGALAHEADATRVEALLELGRETPALRVLDAMALGDSRRDLELRLGRANLRASAGRCLDAEADFAHVLERVPSGPAAEHALYGRASCRTRRADWAGARADLERYLQQFPRGSFSAEARRALERL